MTKIDIVSGFLGAGKTTLIKKLLSEVFAGTKVVLIENEFGEIGIDGGFLKESGIEIREMNAGCICCSLVGDFGTSLKEVMETYAPERILIEPSGVGKLSDVMRAINDASEHTQMHLNSAVAVVDASKCKVYLKNFGEFFDNQIAYAGTIILSRTDKISQEKIDECVELLRALNKDATIITTPISQLDGKMILDTIEGTADLQKQLLEEVLASDEEEDEHEHHHDEDEEEHEHHHHHHGHDADEVFGSWGMETPSRFTADEIRGILKELENEEKYGYVLRSKGMVPAPDGTWIHFDYVPEESEVRTGAPDVTGKICVIGAKLDEAALEKLFKRK